MPLDSVERTLAHKEILRTKSFLRKNYLFWYDFLVQDFGSKSPDEILEIGSGGGFLKEVLPGIITSDIQPIAGVDRCFPATEMHLNDQSLQGICMVNVFHHIDEADKFLIEASRVLKPDGRIIMVEPANTIWSRFVYLKFHHENFDVKGGWKFLSDGPLTSSNITLPWIVFIRDRALFKNRFPEFEIESIDFHNSFQYILSGGFSYRTVVPGFLFGVLHFIDRWLCWISPQFAMFMTIKVRKLF